MLRCGFVGVDRHRDPAIADLEFAARDAKALWALYRDTFPGVDAALLVGDDATTAGVRALVDGALGAATDEDDVVIAFACHGTRDQRLVVHDTDAGGDNAIALSEIVKLFHTSKARSILCVLDCCFAGGAAARVLEGTPEVRADLVDPSAFTGRGRLLLTASAANEGAYGDPRTRHGLLTGALIRVLTDPDCERSARWVLDRTIEAVRSRASALGRSQTPTYFSAVEGHFGLVPLVKGEHYAKAFPETSTLKVSTAIADLSLFGIPEAVIAEWSTRFPGGLNALQVRAVNELRVLDGGDGFVVAPTSCGKTFVGELAAVRAVVDGQKAVFLLPFKALVNEKYEDFRALYGERLGLRVVRCSGDFLDDTSAFLRGQYDVAVLTYELFLALALRGEHVLQRIGLVVLDEAQFISNESRGIVVELLLSRLRAFRGQTGGPQLLALSATVGDLNRFHEWLGLQSLVITERPVPLEFGVLDRRGVFEMLSPDGARHQTQLMPPHEIVQRREKSSNQDVLVPLVRRQLANSSDEKILIFRNKRGSAEGCAKYLAAALHMPSAENALAGDVGHDLSTSSVSLREALRGGVAFHTANLNRDERVAIERAFRDPSSNLRVLVATTTVAAGINTPASTVIIAEHEIAGEKGKTFSRAEIKNMAGRAGRLGFRTAGRAILLSETPIERQRLFNAYVMAEPEPLSSSFRDADVSTWLTRLLAQVKEVDEKDVASLLINTFGGHLAERSKPRWRETMTREIETLVPRLVDDGLLEREATMVRLTLLGRACGESSFALQSALRLIERLRVRAQVSAVEMLALVQVTAEMDACYTPMLTKGQKEARWPNDVANALGGHIARQLQQKASDTPTYWARAKRTCILLDWIDGLPIEQIEKKFSATPFNAVAAGDVRAIADKTRFHLASALRIAELVLPGASPSADKSERLLRQLEVGVPEDALDLLALPVPLARGECLALRAANVVDIEGLARLPREQRQRFLGDQRTQQLELFDLDTMARRSIA